MRKKEGDRKTERRERQRGERRERQRGERRERQRGEREEACVFVLGNVIEL